MQRFSNSDNQLEVLWSSNFVISKRFTTLDGMRILKWHHIGDGDGDHNPRYSVVRRSDDSQREIHLVSEVLCLGLPRTSVAHGGAFPPDWPSIYLPTMTRLGRQRCSTLHHVAPRDDSANELNKHLGENLSSEGGDLWGPLNLNRLTYSY